MRNTMRLFGLASAVALVAACSDSSGPSGNTNLTTQQKVALSNALGNVDDGGTGIAGTASFAVMMVNAVGKLDAGTAAAVADAIDASIAGVRATNYEGAVGLQIIIDGGVDGSLTLTSVIGWDGLNTQAETVDELVMAGALTETATPVGTGSYDMAALTSPFGFGLYANSATSSSYIATTGSFALTAASFTGTTVNCSSQGITCSYRTGSMSGHFNFGSELVSGTGASTYTQPAVSFTNLPSVKVTISGLVM